MYNLLPEKYLNYTCPLSELFFIREKMKKATIIVAHPDDETLWAGGTVLSHPEWKWRIFTLTRRNDPERSAKFRNALSFYGASGEMGELYDGPEQEPFDPTELSQTIFDLLGEERSSDLLLTHGPEGEYTRHVHHEAVSRSVSEAWIEGRIDSEELWFFAYADDRGKRPPSPRVGAELFSLLPEIWEKKQRVVEEIYGFNSDDWEARANQRTESFFIFKERDNLKNWLAGADG